MPGLACPLNGWRDCGRPDLLCEIMARKVERVRPLSENPLVPYPIHPKIDQRTVADKMAPFPDRDLQENLVAQTSTVEGPLARLARAGLAAGSRSNALRRAVMATALTEELTGRHTDDDVIEKLAGV